MRSWNRVAKLLITFTAAVLLTGCSDQQETELNPADPTVITLWHAYNAYAKTVFDECVTVFNETKGMELGIAVEAYGYGSSGELDEALFNSVNGMIGSDPVPDVVTVYPESAYRMDQIVPLADLDQYFDSEELSAYNQAFLDEGRWDGGLKMLPVAKSTELLYINETDWNKFKKSSGVKDELLDTWEGLAKAAELYYYWSGGKAFMGVNSANDFAVLSAVQAGAEPYQPVDGKEVFVYPEEVARRVWNVYYIPHIKGWYKSDRYNQDGIKSGNLIAYIGSSAGAAFFPDEVITGKEKSYPVESRVLSYPYFEGGEHYMPQRGANMCVFTSDRRHELASAEFLKWFTDPQQNVKFAVSTGYIPVKQEALTSDLDSYVKEDSSATIKKSMAAAVKGMESGKFYSKKIFDGVYEWSHIFDDSLSKKIDTDLNDLAARTSAGEKRLNVEEEMMSEENFQSWYGNLIKEMVGKADEENR